MKQETLGMSNLILFRFMNYLNYLTLYATFDQWFYTSKFKFKKEIGAISVFGHVQMKFMQHFFN